MFLQVLHEERGDFLVKGSQSTLEHIRDILHEEEIELKGV
jgi:hypothetical protein